MLEVLTVVNRRGAADRGNICKSGDVAIKKNADRTCDRSLLHLVSAVLVRDVNLVEF